MCNRFTVFGGSSGNLANETVRRCRAREVDPRSDCLSHRAGPRRTRLRRQLQPAGSKSHRRQHAQRELNAKRLELLRELVPNAATIAILINPDNRNHPAHAKVLEAVARSGGQQAVVVEAATDGDFDPAFAKVRQQHADALVVLSDPFFDSRIRQIVELVGRHAVPTIFVWREFVQAGALMSYGMSLADAHRQQGFYTGKILKGAKPAATGRATHQV